MDNQQLELLFLPPYLQDLGYSMIPIIKDLAPRAIIEKEDQIITDPRWGPWRGIFDYLSCVEYGRNILISLSKNMVIDTKSVVPARYNSAAMVFFSRATLDNIALWLNATFNLAVQGGDCAFHKTKFKKRLSSINDDFLIVIDSNCGFIDELQNFRDEWIHRLSGGAKIFSNANPGDPNANVFIGVPINPSINFDDSFQNPARYSKMVHHCMQKNNGRWLYHIEEFANRMADGTKNLVLETLRVSLQSIN